MPDFTLTSAVIGTVSDNTNTNTNTDAPATPVTTPVATPTTPVVTDTPTTPIVTNPTTQPTTAADKPVQVEPRSCKLCTYYTVSELAIRFGLALFLLAAAVLLFRRSGQQPVAQ